MGYNASGDTSVGQYANLGSASGTSPTGTVVVDEDPSHYYGEAFMDFGDALDLPYPTLLVSNGARHIIVEGFHLGVDVDPDPDGQPDANALGDDNDGNDDEDGVIFTSPMIQGGTAKVDVIASADGLLNAWIDFNINGSWADPGDQIFTDQPLVAGVNHLAFPVPCNVVFDGPAFARFRFNKKGGLNYEGPAEDGEVEDYTIEEGIRPEDPMCINLRAIIKS